MHVQQEKERRRYFYEHTRSRFTFLLGHGEEK